MHRKAGLISTADKQNIEKVVARAHRDNYENIMLRRFRIFKIEIIQ